MAQPSTSNRGDSIFASLIVPTIVKNGRLIACTVAVALLGLYAALLYFPPQYEVSASVLFKLGREINAPATASAAQIISGKRPEDVASEIEIMRSQYLMEELVRELGLDYFLAVQPPVTLMQKIKASARNAARGAAQVVRRISIAAGLSRPISPFEQVVGTLMRGFVIEPVRRSDVISLTLRSPDREQGLAVLRKFLDIYLRQHIEVYKTPRARQFFEAESQSLRDRLSSMQKQGSELRDQRGVFELSNQRQLLLAQKSEMESRQMRTAADLKQTEDETAKLEELKASMPAEVEVSRVSERNPVIKSIDEHLAQLDAAREQALTKFAPESRAVADLSEQITRLRATRAKEQLFVVQSVTSSRNDARAQLERAIVEKRAVREGLLAQLREQERQLASLNERLRSLAGSELHLERSDRELALLHKNYVLYAERLEDARISEAMDLAKISNVAVLAPPTASVVPVWPDKRRWALAALGLALAVSLSIAFLKEMAQPTVRVRGEVAEVAGAPVLGCIREAHSPKVVRATVGVGPDAL